MRHRTVSYALALASVIAFAAVPAMAQHHHGGGGGQVWHGGGAVWHGGGFHGGWSPPVYHREWNPGPAIGLGILGGALGAAIVEGAMQPTCPSLQDHLNDIISRVGPAEPGLCWQPVGGDLCGQVNWKKLPCE